MLNRGLTPIIPIIQLKIALESGQPLNLVVSPRTQTISGPLTRQVRRTGGDIFRYNPATGEMTKY